MQFDVLGRLRSEGMGIPARDVVALAGWWGGGAGQGVRVGLGVGEEAENGGWVGVGGRGRGVNGLSGWKGYGLEEV